MTISGDAVDCTDVTLVWELGAVVPTSCDLEIVIPSGAAPAVREAVDVRIADLQFARSWPVFTGTVQKTIATSEPNRVVVRCLDELALLRDTWDGDTDFTGNTDGDVVKQAMDASGITYVPGNIQDAGYQLGAIAQVPIVGTARTARSEIVKSLNEMLRMALVTIGGTPVRFHYSLVPDADVIVKTFTRSETTDFWGNERTRGGLDDIRNIVRVSGPTFNCTGDGDEAEDGSCRCSLWARASAGNVALGSGVRTEPVPIRFDAAQDQDILEWIAEEELTERNRVADLLTVQTGFDPEIVIGHTIGVYDPIAGVNLTSDAADKPYVVTRIEVKNFRATYQCVGGVAGDVDLVTSGVDKQCNKSVGSGTGITPGFSIPPITVPTVPSSTADGCVDLLDADHVAGWAQPSESLAHWTASVGEIAIRSNVASGTPSQGRFTGFKVPANHAWRLTVGFHLHQNHAAIGFGISQSGSTRDFSGSVAGSAFGAINETSARVFPTEDGHAGGVSVDVDHTAVLTWLPSTNTLTLEGIGADVTIVEPTAASLWTIGAVPFLLANLASGGNTAIDAVVVNRYELCLIDEPEPEGDCTDALTASGWTADDGDWDFPASDGDPITATDPGDATDQAHDGDIPVDAADAWRITATLHWTDDKNSAETGVARSADFSPIASVLLYGREDQVGGRSQDLIMEVYAFGGEVAAVFGPIGSAFASDADIDLTVQYDPATGVVAGTATDGTDTYTASVAQSDTPPSGLFLALHAYNAGMVTTGDVVWTALEFCPLGVLDVARHAFYGDWAFDDPGGATFTGDTTVYSGYAYGDGTGIPLDGTQRVRMSGHVELAGDLADVAWQIGLGGSAEDLAETTINGFYPSGTTDAYDANGDYIASGGDPGTSFDFLVDLDPDAGTATFTAGGVTISGAIGSWAAPRYPFLACSGNHHAVTMTVTNLVVAVG